MIEINKLSIQENEGLKLVGIRYTINKQPQSFVIIPYEELKNGKDDVDLKKAVIEYLS